MGGGHGYTLGVSSARSVVAGPASLSFSLAPLPGGPSTHDLQEKQAEQRAATASQGQRDTWRPEQLAAGGSFDHRIQSNRLPRLSTPCCSSLGSAAWTGVAYIKPPPRKPELRPEKRPTVDVHWCLSPRISAASILERHDDVLRNAQRLRMERGELFANLRRVHARQHELKAAARPKSVQSTLRMNGVRTARPAWGLHDYGAPVTAEYRNGHQVARS